MTDPISRASRAIVIGSGIAGLCTARALLDSCDEVLVLDRDRGGSRLGARPGVPQGVHSHALLARGRSAIAQLFPGVDAALLACGAPELDLGRDVAVLTAQGWLPQRETGLRALFASRPLLEAQLKRSLHGFGGVSLRDGAEVVGLVRDPRAVARIRGVQLRDGELEADLVVDASGRASHALDWLEAAGFSRPDESVVDAGVGYSTRWYEADAGALPPSVHHQCSGIMIHPTPSDPRSGVLFPVEGKRWIASVVTAGGMHPPTDAAGLDAAFESLRSPLLAEALKGARPITRVYGSRATANRYRRYHRRWRGPSNFLAVGDAVCSPNPVYAQGMSLSALSALALRQCCARYGVRAPALARAFFVAQARILDPAWQFAIGADFRLPGTQGQRPAFIGVLNGYMDRLIEAAADDPVVQLRFFQVLHLVEPPHALLLPTTGARVGISALHRKLRRFTRCSSLA